MVGVHTPEFPFERDVENVRWAAKDMARRVSDRARQRLRGLAGVRQQLLAGRVHRGRGGTDPASPLRRGRLRRVRAGRSRCCCDEAGRSDVGDDLVSVAPDGFEAQADWATLGSPETYLGYEQAQNFASPGGADVRRARSYVVPEPLELNQWALSGDWTVASGASVLERSRRADRVPLPRPRRQSRDGTARARSVRAVPRARRRSSLPAPLTGSTSTRTATERSAEQRLYQLVRQPGSIDRPHVRDRVPRSGRRGLLLHVRLEPTGATRPRAISLTALAVAYAQPWVTTDVGTPVARWPFRS